MTILVAFDKFKDSLSAHTACALVTEALRIQHPLATILQAPLTDGGEGFCEILTLAHGGRLEFVPVMGPRFEPVQARLGWVSLANLPPLLRDELGWPSEGEVAIIEMAQASGLELIPKAERNCWQTTTYGTGQLIKHALDHGASALLLGIGGSATCDLGLGALQALGLKFMDGEMREVKRVVPEEYPRITSIQGTLPQLPVTRVACDVRNPLLGVEGTAAIYGPQKGLTLSDIPTMDATLERMALLLTAHFSRQSIEEQGAEGRRQKAEVITESPCYSHRETRPRVHATERTEEPGSGAAGGIGFGLRTASNQVAYVAGFEMVWQWLQLQQHLAAADIVITGEGRFDASSLQGKGPGTLVREATGQGKKVFVLAGQVTEGLALPEGVTAMSITPAGVPLAQALSDAPVNLRKASQQVAAMVGM